MLDDLFSGLVERIGRFDLLEEHTPEEWQSFFGDGVRLLDCPEDHVKDYAIERMQKGILSENSQHYKQPQFSAAPAEVRLLPIFDAIVRQEEREHLLLRFVVWNSFSEPQREFLSSWLAEVEAAEIFSADAAAVARVEAELYPKHDWDLARGFIEPFFDHSNDLVRASAAAALGEMYIWKADNLPPLAEIMKEVKAREIVRPGFAGPFLGQLLMDLGADGEVENSGVKLADWIVEIIGRRHGDEPCVPFYNGINFHAHEVLSSNPAAIRKLIDFGAETVAAMAATEEDRPIDGMQELLEELAFSSDDFVARICSWHLAYNYRFLHAEGRRRGYVGLEERQDVEVFLAFYPEEHGERPYAATIYPCDFTLDDHIAWQWIDRLIPPYLRPPITEDEPLLGIEVVKPASMSVVYGHYIIEMIGDCEEKRWDRVWIKWPLRSCEW